jgi:hypothetical protein
MRASGKSEVSTGRAAEFTLMPAKLDFTSVKTQFVIGVVLIAIASFAVYAKALGVGFLGDDFLHIDYVTKAFRGDWNSFLNNFTGNWANSNVMKSYRPLTSSSLFIDYAIWGLNAAGFHLTNILLLAGCSVFTGLITLELTGQRGNRLGATAAIWAALLFAVYPLHAESVAWIIGRVDLLCTFFYLASVFCYLRFRLLRESTYRNASWFCFAAALASKEVAVTLPVVILLAEVLLFRTPPRSGESARHGSDHFFNVGSFFMVLFMFASIRFLMIETLIGGYGDSFDLAAGLTNLVNKDSLLKVVYPASEEYVFASWIHPVLLIAYAAIGSSLVVRFLQRSVRSPAYMFVLLWLLVSIVPAYQIWHIHPNLSGSRLFYLTSAPTAILLALMAVPALDVMRKRYVKGALVAGTIALSTIFACWCYLLLGNLQAWVSAGQQLTRLRSQAVELIKAAPAGAKVLLADLPTDYKGAMMVSREHYLHVQLRPPFTREDLTSKVLTVEPVGLGSHQFIWPGQLSDALASPAVQPYKWYSREARFIPFGTTGGSADYNFKANESTADQLKFEPPSGLLPSEDKWRVQAENVACVTTLKDMIRIYPGKEKVTVTLPRIEIDPRRASVLSLRMDMSGKDACQGCHAEKLRFFFDAETNDGSIKRGYAQLVLNTPGFLIGWLGRYRDWTLARRIVDVGFTLEPGEYYADFREIHLMPAEQGVPQLKVVQPPIPTGLQPLVDPPDNAVLVYDISKVPNGASALIVFTKPGTTFDAASETAILNPRPTIGESEWLAQITPAGTKGIAAIPPAVLSSPGLHQARVMALGKDNLPRGVGSEPITIIINTGKDKSPANETR